MKQWFFLLFITFWLGSNGQNFVGNDSVTAPTDTLHRMTGNWMHRTENSFGLVPTLTVGRHTFLGASVAKGWFTAGEYGGNGAAALVGTEYNPNQKIFNLHATGFIHVYSVIGGLNFQLSAIRYHQNQLRAFAIRPQVGLGLLKGYINYGYNLFTYQEIPHLAKHSITFSFYITAFPWK